MKIYNKYIYNLLLYANILRGTYKQTKGHIQADKHSSMSRPPFTIRKLCLGKTQLGKSLSIYREMRYSGTRVSNLL